MHGAVGFTLDEFLPETKMNSLCSWNAKIMPCAYLGVIYMLERVRVDALGDNIVGI